jgi:putative ABC transport system permease protein
MNLALRDIRHNLLRFALTGLGLGGLPGIAVTMAGIYEGALDDALRLPRATGAELWVVQPRTKGPFAEPSRIPRDTRELVRRLPGVAAAGAVTFQTVQTAAAGRPLRRFDRILRLRDGRLVSIETLPTQNGRVSVGAISVG